MSAPAAATWSGQWSDAVAAHSRRPFLTFEAPDGTSTTWSYADFDGLVARTAGQLAIRGVGPDVGVHLALTNSPRFVATWLATNRLGGFVVPSDPMATAPELAEHIARTRPAVGVCAADRADVYRSACAALDDVAVTPAILEADEADATMSHLDGVAAVDEWPDVSPRDRAAVMFTSGTTGRPKGVVVTQANYAFAGSTMAAASTCTADDRLLVVLPLFHANAQYYSFAAAISVGASVALMHTFSASRFCEQAARHGATHASLFAGPMRMILARGGPVDDPERPVRLRHCWFAQNLAADQYETLAEWFGCRPRQLYGMTETIPAVLTDLANDPRPDTMGVVTAGCEVEVHDAEGRRCPTDVVGEVVVRGQPGVTLFDGYLDDPDTTATSFRGEWFRTGDRAWVDADGRFHFDGRRADVLKVAGENVSVVEVEAVVTAHPDVLEAVVVGAPDPIRDEVPVAFVVPSVSGSGALSPTELVDRVTSWCDERLGKAKRPRRITVVDELPRTSVGKIRKFLLAEAAVDAAASPAHPSSSPR